MLIGYARVSTDAQDLAAQLGALRRAGITRIVGEKRSGAVDRPRLDELLAKLKPGDTVVVWKVDRLARSLRGLLDTHDKIKARRASLRSLTEPIDTGTPIGEAFFQLLGVFAQLERSLIRERCAAGRVEARARGVRFGRPRGWDYQRAFELRDKGMSWQAVADELRQPVTSVRRAVAAVRAGDIKA